MFNSGNQGLRLELLESRTLLASSDPSFDLVTPAVEGTGDFTVDFNTRFGNSRLEIVGTADSSLSIDFDRLPEFVTSIAISNFDKVEFTGIDKLDTLIATNIGSLDAPGITLKTGLSTTNVGEIALAFTGDIAVLKGTATELSATSVTGTTIVSDLSKLEITSASDEVFVISGNPDLEVRLGYEPESILVVGLSNWEKQIVFTNRLPEGPSTPGGGVVVVEVPSDERTDLFLSRLRELLRAPQLDSSQQIFDFVAMNSLRGDSAAEGVSAGVELLPHSLSHVRPADLARVIDQPVELGTREIAVDDSTLPALPTGDVGAGWERNLAPDRVQDFGFTSDDLGGALVFADSELGIIRLSETPVELAPTMRVEEMWGVLVASIDDRPKDLAQHIWERISKELSPAQQTAFLLVDPKPTRPAADRNREPIYG